LKIENILISQSGDVKIIDFGLSNTYSHENLLKTFCGSLYFAAPELLSAHPYCGPEIDIWSFGVVLYVLVCGKVPFDDQSMPALHSKIKRGHVEYPAWISSDCRDLLSRMLVVDPLQRASLAEVKRHPWMIKGYDKPPDSLVPFRRPITLPLDPAIIQEMSGFEFGTPEKILSDMTAILESPQYIEACKTWYRVHGYEDMPAKSVVRGHAPSESVSYDRKPRHFGLDFYKRRSSLSAQDQPPASQFNTLDPTNAYHPLLSIYYLVTERQERLKNQDKLTQHQQRLQQQQSQQQQQQQQQLALQQQQKALQQQQIQKAHQQQQQALQKQQEQQEELAKFTAPAITVPEAVHAASESPQTVANATGGASSADYNNNLVTPPIAAPRTRARSKTHGPADQHIQEEKFIFGDAAPETITATSGNREQPHGGISIATSLFRRFSSKRKNGREVSAPNPTTQTTTSPTTQTGSLQRRFSRQHQQHFSQPANVYVPEQLDLSQHPAAEPKFVRKPVSGQPPSTQQLSRSVSTRQSTKFAPDTKNEFTEKKRYHPSARAKSLGHVRGDAVAQHMMARLNREDSSQQRLVNTGHAPPGASVANSSANPGSADITDELFDEYDEYSQTGHNNNNNNNFTGKAHLSKNSISGGSQTSSQNSTQLHRTETIAVGAMPSIEYPKQVFLKGFFSVQSTSTKSLAYIRMDIIRVLNHLGVEYKEIKGGFSCVHRPSIRTSAITDEDPFAGSASNVHSPQQQQQYLSPPNSPLPDQQQQRGHWRKLSFGSGIFGNNRRRNMGSSGNIVVDYSDFSTDSVSGHGAPGPSNGGQGNSDMLGNGPPPSSSAAAAARTPLQFEIWIVRIPLLSLHGVQFKKLRGNSWLYKSLASKILAELRL
jgi:protein-serine/threonine kinase